MVPCGTLLGGWNALHLTRDNNIYRNPEVFITAILGACQSIIDYEEQRSEICSVLRSEIWEPRVSWAGAAGESQSVSALRGVNTWGPRSHHQASSHLICNVCKWRDDSAYYNSIFFILCENATLWQPHENSLNGQFSSFIDCKDTIKASFLRNIPRHV